MGCAKPAVFKYLQIARIRIDDYLILVGVVTVTR